MHGPFLLLLVTLVPAAAAAQAAPAGWQLAAGAGLASFSNVATRRDGAGTTHVGPAPATRFGVALSRRCGGWEARVGADLLAANLQLRDDAVMIEARDAPFTRVRWEAMAGRTIARVGNAGLVAGAGPALELWLPSGADWRSRIAAAARLILRIDAGPFALENSISASISASPLEEDELPAGYRRRALRTIVVGAELSFGL